MRRLTGASSNTCTKFAPVPNFDFTKIPKVGIKVLSQEPLPTARKIIARGLNAIKEENTLLMKL